MKAENRRSSTLLAEHPSSTRGEQTPDSLSCRVASLKLRSDQLTAARALGMALRCVPQKMYGLKGSQGEQKFTACGHCGKETLTFAWRRCRQPPKGWWVRS